MAAVSRLPGLDPGPGFFSLPLMDRERQGGWVDIMASRYRGTMYERTVCR